MLNILRKIATNKVIRYAYIGWFAIALFYLYQYILRVSPGILIEDIRHHYKVTAEEFSSLGFYYLIAYSLLQIPLGILVDRLGVKKVCLASIALCSLGSYIFSHAEHFHLAQLSRFMIGAGSASAFMCGIKFISDHIPPGNRGFLMGATLALGTVGAIFSSKLVALLDVAFNWQEIINIGVYLGIGVFIIILFVVKNAKQDEAVELYSRPISDNFKDLWRIARSKKIVLYAILAVGLYSPLSALADLWGAGFIRQKFSLSKADAAQFIMMIYIGLTFGSLILPWICERRDTLNKAIALCSFALLFSFSLLLYFPSQSLFFLASMLFLIGFFGGAEMMCFTGALVNSKASDSGQIIGFVNTLNMLCGGLIQWIVGFLLDLQWQYELDEYGVRVYSDLQYENAFSSLTLLIGVCAIFSLLLLRIRKVKQLSVVI